MGRPLKTGLEYYPVDTDIFSDIKVRKLIKYHSAAGFTVYSFLLGMIYRNGYYLDYDQDLPFIVSDALGMPEEDVKNIINGCLDVRLFDEKHFSYNKILTSKGIQERYHFVCQASKRSTTITKYNLVSSEETPVISEQIQVSSEKNKQKLISSIVSSEESTQSKVKERKVNKIKVEERKGKESENAGISSGSPPPDFSNSKNGIEDLSLKAENENKKKPGRAARKDTSELLSLEDWGDRERFDAAMPEDWPEAKKEHYWFALLIHSNKGNKYKNWALTAMNWARKDEKNEETPWVKAGNKTTKPKESPAQTDDITRIIDEFNALTGSDYDTANEEIRGYLAGRLMDGCQLQDMLDVIALKAIEWGGAEQRKYLKFQTLFKPANYPGYVQEVKDAKAGKIKVKPNETHAERYKRTTRELEHALAVIEGRLPHPGKVA